MMKRLPALLAVLLLAASRATLSPAPAKDVITLTRKPGFWSEPAVAIDPGDPRRVLAAYQVGGFVDYSRDAGRTWKSVSAVPHDHRLVDGDVSVTYDARGHAILCYIAFDKLGTESYWAHHATRNGIFVERSNDGGIHWLPRAVAVKAPVGRPDVFEDKPYVVADDTHGPYRGNLYIGWTEFHRSYSEMLFSRSTNGGVTWSHPLRISTVNGLPRDDNGATEGFDGAVGPHGTLYTVWQNGTHVVLAVSHDGGRSFDASRNIIAVPSMNYYVQGYQDREVNGFPQIALAPKTDRLFITWSDYRNGEVDIFSSTSTDRGRTWSAPVKVNDDPAHDGRDHFFQWLSVDPITGDAYVIFDDRRGDRNNEIATITLARSTDGGRSYRNYEWTTKAFDPSFQFMGDYNGIAAYAGRVYGVWTETAPTHAKRWSKAWRAPRTIVRLGMAQF